MARLVVAAFRIDAARACADAEVAPLVEELSRSSAEFASMWRDNNVQMHGTGVKRLRHPRLGPITLEYSAFAVDARPDLSLIVYNPATPADQKPIASLVNESPKCTGYELMNSVWPAEVRFAAHSGLKSDIA